MRQTYEPQNDLRVADINVYNNAKTFVGQMKSRGLWDKRWPILADDVDHQHADFNYHTCIRMSHAIEMVTRTAYTGDDYLRPERKNIITLILLKCCLPLVSDTQVSFVWKKPEHALHATKLLKTQVQFLPKPQAALMTVDKSKAKRPRRSQTAGAATTEPATPSIAELPDPSIGAQSNQPQDHELRVLHRR